MHSAWRNQGKRNRSRAVFASIVNAHQAASTLTHTQTPCHLPDPSRVRKSSCTKTLLKALPRAFPDPRLRRGQET